MEPFAARPAPCAARLDLGKNDLRGGDAVPLGRVLGPRSGVTALLLRENNLGDGGVAALAQATPE